MQGERCYCGNEDCPCCYPGRSRYPWVDEDDAYERFRQDEIDGRWEKEQRAAV